ncbi:MAG TPA: GAF domain-containing protein [Aggregatilineales bacterium]|nr:GAF domain-containing protein [Aggregatilineales bacterium]
MPIDEKRILVVSNDVVVIRQIHDSLFEGVFSLQNAYSHGDALYALESSTFDVILVDDRMISRESGEPTPTALARLKPMLPVIAISQHPLIQPPGNLIPVSLGQAEIHQALARLFQPNPRRQGVTRDIRLGLATTENLPAQREELEALFELSKSLTEVLDLGEVLNRVVEAARRLTKAEEGMILLPDEESGDLLLRAKVGIDHEDARNFRVRTDDTHAGNVMKSGLPLLIGGQGLQKVKTEYLVHSLLYVPIIYENRTIGVLGVNNRVSNGLFNLRQQELLTNLASFAAIAIENARVHEESVERTLELQTLVEASLILNSTLSLEHTLPTICEQLLRILNVNLAQIYTWDSELNWLRAMARSVRSSWAIGQGQILKLPKSSSLADVLQSHEPCFEAISDVSTSSDIQTLLEQRSVSAVQIIPVTASEQVIGVLFGFYRAHPQAAPSPEQIQKAHRTALETFVSLTGQLRSAQVAGIYRVFESLVVLLNADWCELAIWNADKFQLSTLVEVGDATWLVSPQPYIDLNQYPDIAEPLQSATSFINISGETGRLTPGYRALIDETHSRVVLGLPLIQRGQVRGMVLFADGRRNRVFSDRELALGRALVGQAATALENASLIYDLEQSLIRLQETQDRLVQTARLTAMGELAAAVAHQINNPLTTIMVDSEMMLLDEPPGSRNYRSIESIHRAGKRAVGVAKRLLAIARPSDPESPPMPIDVVDTIQGVLSLVQARIERNHIRVLADLPAGLPPVWAVPGTLDDIWLNLLMNAHDAMLGRPESWMSIKARYISEDQVLEVIVEDNGPGIPEAIQHEVFKPFFTTKPIGEGTGIGLHICRQSAEQAGGSIQVESEVGSGTRFLVRLPVNREGDSL